MSINSQTQKLLVEGLLYFYELFITDDIVIRFHCNGPTEQVESDRISLVGPMTFQGHEYEFVGADHEGIQLSSASRVNEINLLVANTIGGVQGYVTVLCQRYKDMVGARLHIYATTLENMNNSINGFSKQVWFIAGKSKETAEAVEFTLSSPIDFGKMKLPTRIVFHRCTWAMRGEYRGEECGYTGTKYFNEKGEPVTTRDQDVCGGCLSDCRLRFGRHGTLPFGGQPTAGLF